MFYYYVRVSTIKQDIGRQIVALDEWKKEKNINVPKENIFIDYCTGKNFKREEYQKMKSKLKENDYLIIKEVDRLGRNWDEIKSEWQELKKKGVNIIIIDIPLISDTLPNEKSNFDGLEEKLIKNQMFELMCYIAQKEREKISQRTKEGLNKVKIYGSKTGNPIGRPKDERTTKENLIKAIEIMTNENVGQRKASIKANYPETALRDNLKKLYVKYNTKNYRIILEKLKQEEDIIS